MGKVRIFETINDSILSLVNSYGVKLRIGTICCHGIIESFENKIDYKGEPFIMAKLKPTHTDGRPIAFTSFHVDVLRIFDKNYLQNRRRILLLLK